MMMNKKATHIYQAITVYDSECDGFYAYHCICHTGMIFFNFYVTIICMLQVGGREEIYIMWFQDGKRVSLWFDSSQDCYASGLD